jgi:glycine/D-amino acid oxidase-like deaminating enzyme
MPQFSNVKEAAYWMDPHPTIKNYANKPLPEKTDVLVIGGGNTGTVAAFHLRKAGVDVTLIDQARIGTEASARNGGMVLTGWEATLQTIMKKFGKEKMIRYFNESVEAINCVERLVEDGNIDCDFVRSGYMLAAYKPSHLDFLKQNQEFLEKYFDFPTHLIPAEKMHDEIGSDLYHGGLVEPTSAGIQPAKYIAGLIRMADDTGVDIHEYIQAIIIEKQAGKIKVTTSRGVIIADNIVLATNGYTTNMTPWQMRRIVPEQSLMIATEKLPPEVAKTLIPNNRMIFDTKTFLYYFRLSPDGKRMLFGGVPKQLKKPVLEKARDLRNGMLSVYPQLAKYDIAYTWWGKLAFTVDHLPIIGERDGIYYGMGYCGHGVALSTYFGLQLSDMILGKGLNTVVGEKRSIPIPLYRGNPWFLPMAHTYFSILDKIK